MVNISNDKLDGILAQLSTLTEQVNKLIADNGVSIPEMVDIPSGEFIMGDNDSPYSDEKPEHRVQVNEFRMGKYPITFDEYDEFCKNTGRTLPDDEGWGRGRRPVINVNLIDAKAYCEWLSKKTGRKFRLPTEEEWEYAAKAGQHNKKLEPLGDYAWYYDNSDGMTHPVGEKKPNPWGLFDMLGNVFEWTQTPYESYADD